MWAERNEQDKRKGSLMRGRKTGEENISRDALNCMKEYAVSF